MLMKTKALVLREVSYKESDRILTLLTQERGKLSANARGSRKKGSAIAAGTQLLCWSELVLSETRGRWSVKEAAVERQFRGMRAELERFALGCYFAEAAQVLALEELPTPELLSLTLNSLHVLDKKPELPLALVKTVFEWRCMCASGYEPQLEGCALCGAPVRLRGHGAALEVEADAESLRISHVLESGRELHMRDLRENARLRGGSQGEIERRMRPLVQEIPSAHPGRKEAEV